MKAGTISLKGKNILYRKLGQSKVCFSCWILYNITELIISYPVLKIKF